MIAFELAACQIMKNKRVVLVIPVSITLKTSVKCFTECDPVETIGELRFETI